MQSYNPSDVPTLRTYAEASEHEANIKPYRGRAAGSPKPIEKRSKDKYTIWRDTADCIHVRHWKTDVVTYTPDNYVLINMHPIGDTTTTRAYINAVVFGAYERKLRKEAGRHFCTVSYREGGKVHTGQFLVPSNGVVKLRWSSDLHDYEIFDPMACYQHKLNRKRMKEVRQECKPLIDYITSMCAIRADDRQKILVTESLSSMRLFKHHKPSLKERSLQARHTRQAWRETLLSCDLDNHADIMSHLVTSNAIYDWNTRAEYASVTDVLNNLDYLIKYAFARSAGLFQRITLPWGTVRADKNGDTFHL